MEVGNVEIEKVLKAVREGTPVILLDDPKREGEADIVVHASKFNPNMARLFRKDAGGMICLCTTQEITDKLGLCFYSQLLRESKREGLRKIAMKIMPYGDEPSFCTYINSKKCYTGISDDDRSMTVREFEKMVSGKKLDEFSEKFYAPGHVPLLASRGIEKRRGHTEMAVELCLKAGLSPAVVICEMLGDDGKALSWKGALEYAKKNGFLAIEGKEIK
ncbi:3,4-dihydroxy-2-butanone 4-phosphate synthase [Candidatus Micrarchaeota archaeon CG10_big_fil_rev_8_21_14_0_10_45_29]|nr:MAG: 3,4-dihydroxy-2-butanone 4-phosphate synthase [Candidatus Micrarchaeota archaeon CG10_big_fil_rev_8_21_14_0_10_45_29]